MADDPLRLWEAWRTRGDERAFEDLVRPDLGRAVALARSEGCPPGEAEDAVQESLVRLAREKSDVPGRVGVRGWFFGIVRDRAHSRLRSDRRRRRREHEVSVPEAVSDEVPRFALREEVDRALAELPEEEREAVRLRYLLDLEYREVAYILGVSEGACRMRVLRALKRIRGTLGAGAGAALAAVVFPAPAQASTLVSSAIVAAPASAVTAVGGTLLMTTGQKLALSIVIAALLGAAMGAGVMQHLGAPHGASTGGQDDRLRAEAASLRAELARSRAEAERLRSAPPADRVAGTTPSPVTAPEEPPPPAAGRELGVRVRAVDEGGAAVAKAQVVVKRFESGGMSEIRRGTTDATGTVTLADLPEGSLQIDVTRGSGGDDTGKRQGSNRSISLSVFKGEGVRDARVVFPACVPVTGVVTHARLGPLAGVTVISNGPRDRYGYTSFWATTDQEGRYRFELPPGENRVGVTGKVLAMVRQWRVEVPQDAPEVRRDFLVGVPAVRVSVRHRDTGEPIRAAEVLLDGPLDDKAPDFRFQRMAASDDSGEAAFEDRPPGKYTAMVRKSGFGEVLGEVEIADGGSPAELELAIGPLVDVALEIVTPDGRPYVGLVNVMWTARGPTREGGGAGWEFVCDENGVASLTRRIGPGEWRLSASVKGVARGSVNATVASSASENRFRIQLAKE